MDVLYENIKRLRKEAKLSQEELAKMVGYTDRSSIAKIESGEVDLNQSKIQAFADAFGVTPQYLMGYTNEKPVPSNRILPDFKTAPDAIKFMLEIPMVEDFGGYDTDRMTDEQLINFAKEVAGMIQVMSGHYPKKEE